MKNDVLLSDTSCSSRRNVVDESKVMVVQMVTVNVPTPTKKT